MVMQFFHQKYRSHPRFTVAVVPPKKEQLFSIISNNTFQLNISLGVAKCCVKEKHYVKKIGRELSSKRVSLKSYSLSSVIRRGNRTFFCFVSDKNTLVFRTHDVSDDVYLIEADGEF